MPLNAGVCELRRPLNVFSLSRIVPFSLSILLFDGWKLAPLTLPLGPTRLLLIPASDLWYVLFVAGPDPLERAATHEDLFY